MPKKKNPLTEKDVFGTDPMLKALEEQDITCDDLAKKLRAELDSKETKFFAHKGKLVQKVDVINWATRQKARMDAHRLRGDYPADVVEHDLSANIMTIAAQVFNREKNAKPS